MINHQFVPAAKKTNRHLC